MSLLFIECNKYLQLHTDDEVVGYVGLVLARFVGPTHLYYLFRLGPGLLILVDRLDAHPAVNAKFVQRIGHSIHETELFFSLGQ